MCLLFLFTVLARRDHARPDRGLTNAERRFMLNAERGDCASVVKILEQHQAGEIPESLDINCTDPLGRTSLSIAIINENPEMIEILLESGIQTRDSLLLAIDEQYVEGVELLLEHEERIWQADTPHSWEAIDPVSAQVTRTSKRSYSLFRLLTSTTQHWNLISLLSNALSDQTNDNYYLSRSGVVLNQL